ncbi:replication factor c protein, putative [Plasmodium gallinaceum]|uniref:Replication factor c protein, putative n=1 Tax=Plasmodium gallinaceum TaxID=5849 RepID=A0A1J1GM97_PLAGA|nr:replication factor c protein, putative [Plasmodium gallinaceum]CRG93365.1 replication factor c protein, putative [Plasmodium gallinaceum]
MNDDIKSYLDDLNGIDNILNEEIEKEKKLKEKRKFDIYDEYELLLNKKKKKKNINLDRNNNGTTINEGNIKPNPFNNIIYNRTFHNNYIFNDYEFLKEYVYKNNLISDDIFFKKEEITIKEMKEKKKLLDTNEDINDFIKIYHPNELYPPMYVKKESKKERDEEKKKENLENEQGINCKNNKEFRILMEKLLLEIKEEDKIINEKKKIEKNKKDEERELKKNVDLKLNSNEQENINSSLYDDTIVDDMNLKKENVKNKKKVNFVEKYRAKYFSELLTDESINREVLQWLKKWVDRIKKEKKIYENNEVKEEYEKNDFQRILLLGGSAGKGKTTLAHVIANHFKFNIIEINGSDDRNKETLIPFIESIVCINSIGSKPNICIIDEIDGLSSTYQNIDSIMKFLNKKDKKNRSIIKRPIICICNDIYHKSLKELRKICKVVVVENVNIEMLKTRINYICDRENVKISNETVNKLIEIYKGDIRAILNMIYFLSIGMQNSSNYSNYSTYEQKKNENGDKILRKNMNSTSKWNNSECDNINKNYSNNKKNKNESKIIINIDLLNSYLFYKDANNNFIELLNMIYVKNKNKKITNKLLKECYNFFYINLANEYNYLQSYYYIYDNLLNIPFNDFDFCKLSYCLDFLSFCDSIEYKQKQNLNYSLQKTLYFATYLFIIIIHLNTNSHIQYTLLNNSHSNYFRKKQNEIKKMKDNFINEKYGVITYKYVYSKNFFFETINYLFSFFYMNEFFFKNVHLWGKQSYYKELDLPKYILVPYEHKDINKFQIFCLKILYIMTLFNISFTNISVSTSHSHTHISSYKNYRNDTNQQNNEKNNISLNSQIEKSYVFDPFVDDFLIFADKKSNVFPVFNNMNKNVQVNLSSSSFKFKTKNNFLNTNVCESLNELKKWINNNSINFNEKSNLNQMQIIKASKKNNSKKSAFEANYISNFEISLSDMILIANQNSYKKTFQKYFENIDKKKNQVNLAKGENARMEQNILKTKILCNKRNDNLTISELINEEKKYMNEIINKEKKIYFSGKYVKTKGYYKNIEERCNAVLQPLNFCILGKYINN